MIQWWCKHYFKIKLVKDFYFWSGIDIIIVFVFRDSNQENGTPARILFEFFILIMVAIMIISYKGYVLFYVCVARMLKNAFKEWNKWAMEVLNRNQGNTIDAFHPS